jgi:hypothetical protein
MCRDVALELTEPGLRWEAHFIEFAEGAEVGAWNGPCLCVAAGDGQLLNGLECVLEGGTGW